MKLIIAEKPELAEDIAKAILKNYKTIAKGFYINNEYTCISAFGHLLSLKEPEDIDEKYSNRSNITLLPIYFKNWQRIADKEPYKYNRLKQIGKSINECNCIIHAGDPDEEGQLLIDEIIDYFNYSGPVYRVLVNDNIDKNIIKAFSRMMVNDESFKNKGKSAYARQMADKTVGINESRLACSRLNVSGLSIGRVQTPTLALIVNRDLAIEEHQEQKYFTLSTCFDLKNSENTFIDIPFTYYPSDKILEDHEHIYSKDSFNQVINNIDITRETDVQNYTKKFNPPFPFSLTTLSSLMNEKYGYSSAKTLQITQELRDKYKAITYNRTDSEYLKDEHYLNAPKLIPIIFKNISQTYPIDFSNRSACFNDQYAPTHHAIIPQEKEINLNHFTEEQKNVYVEICNRYIMQFLNPEIKEISECIIPINNLGNLKYSFSKILDLGYKKHFINFCNDQEELEENIGRFITKGKYYATFKNHEIKEKSTKPLKSYTEGSLIKDMCNISKYVTDQKLKEVLKLKDKGKKGENGSIGTTATRPGIIELLKKRGFIELQGKKLISSKLGQDFIKIIPESLKSANMTAQWYLLQEMIREGKSDENIVMLSAVKDFKERLDTSYTNVTLKCEKEVFCECPFCNGAILKRVTKSGTIYMCENYGKECSTLLKNRIKYFDQNLVITDNKALNLLLKKEVKFKLKTRNGKSYDAYFHICYKEYQGKQYLNLIKSK